jgi:elongation factor Ts
MNRDHGQIHSCVHRDGQIGVLADIRCSSLAAAGSERFKSLCNDVCLQICAAAPLAVSRDALDPLVVARQREHLTELTNDPARSQSANVKIVNGYLEKWYAEVCLLEQAFVKDVDKSIGQLIDDVGLDLGAKIVIRRFTRYDLTNE